MVADWAAYPMAVYMVNLAKALTSEVAHSGRRPSLRPWQFLRVSCLFLRHRPLIDRIGDQTCDDAFIPFSVSFVKSSDAADPSS
ncbi:hypothetical protein EMIT0194P_220045 [Pseudomonas serbica]